MVVFYSYVSLPEGIQSTKSSSMMRSSGESQFRQVSEDRPIIFFAEPPLAKIPKKTRKKIGSHLDPCNPRNSLY